MTKREKLQAQLHDAEQCRDAYIAGVASIKAQLDALPKERVRLRAEKSGVITLVYAGERKGGEYLCALYQKDCEASGVSHPALAAHICRFGEPDVSTTSLTQEHELLIESLIGNIDCWWFNHGKHNPTIFDIDVYSAYQALDAARKGGA